MKQVFRFAFALIAICFLLSCSHNVIVAEALQTSEQASIYTKYNLWYEDPMKMDTLNCQKGKIIPFGTEVIVKSASDRKICFMTLPDKQEFCIYFSTKYRLISLDTYVRELFTTKSFEELSVGIHPTNIVKIQHGIVEKGMTREEVLLAFGPPCAYRTRSQNLNTWCYWTDYLIGKRVVFTNDRVSTLLSIDSDNKVIEEVVSEK